MPPKLEKILYCESTIYTGKNDDEDDSGPPHILILAEQMQADSEEETIPGTEEVHFLYTPTQVRQFITDNEMDPESRDELEELIEDLETVEWRDLAPLHLNGHHAQAIFNLAIVALSDDEPETEEDIDSEQDDEDGEEGSGLPN